MTENEQRLKGIFDYAALGIAEVDENDRFINVNKRLCDILGYTREELLGKAVFDIIVPEDLPHSHEINMKIHKGELNVFDYEKRYVKRDGTRIWVHVSFSAVRDSHGQLLRTVRTIENITSRKLAEGALQDSEKKFRILFETMAQGVVYQAIDGQVISANPAAEKMLGITLEQMKNRNSFDPVWEAIHEDGTPFSGETHPAMVALRTGLPVRDIVMGIHHPQMDEYRWLIISAIPQFRENETKPFQVFTSFTDISELKKNEKALLESENRLQELNLTKDKLFSILSHDLKDPFTSIVGFSELLLENIHKKDFEDIESYAVVISESSQNAMNLLTNLIDWSRLQTGRIKFNPIVFSINTLISEVLDLFSASATKKSLTITSDVPAQINVFADRFMINTVLRNLISNAVKFSHPKGKILISALNKESEVIIRVVDSGVGMSQKTIEKLFKFANFSTPGTQNEKGTGLGMILIEEFISKHEGKILIESEVGKGTSFNVTLPLKLNS